METRSKGGPKKAPRSPPDQDDLLPERVVGEEPINERALREELNPEVVNPERRGDSYNVDPSAEKQDPFDEDLIGIPPIEDEPVAADILPDQVRVMPGAPPEDEEAETARPRQEHRPLKPDGLPS